MNTTTAHTDSVGNPLSIGDQVCWGWKTSEQIKRTGEIVRFRGSLAVINNANYHGTAVALRDLLIVP